MSASQDPFLVHHPSSLVLVMVINIVWEWWDGHMLYVKLYNTSLKYHSDPTKSKILKAGKGRDRESREKVNP